VAESTFDGEGSVSVPFEVLAEDLPVGQPYNVATVTDAGASALLALDTPTVNFDTHVVLVFDLAESSTPDCWFQPTSLLVFDKPQERLYPLVLMSGQTNVNDLVGCDEDSNPHRIVLSVARSDLPPTFSLWIDGDDPPGCCEEQLLVVAEGELAELDSSFPPLTEQGILAIGDSRAMSV
jgi:hypothetical protein